MIFVIFFFFKQKTAYEMRISDWSSDVCSSDLQQENFRMIVGDGLGHVLQQHGLTGARRCDDQGALALALRADEIDHTGRLVLNRGVKAVEQIGRASCRERVCQYV